MRNSCEPCLPGGVEKKHAHFVILGVRAECLEVVGDGLGEVIAAGSDLLAVELHDAIELFLSRLAQ